MKKPLIPYTIPVKPLYKKDNGMYVIDLTAMPFDSGHMWIEKVTMSLPPFTIAGNHRHKHIEAIAAMTAGLEFYWQDTKSKIHMIPLYKANTPFFLIIPSFIPHAVKNNAQHHGVMIKLADELPGIMERIMLV